jgi:hypothetical protein
VVSSPTFSSNVKATDTVIFQQPPPITWATPAPIVYGTALSGAQLDAASTLPGSFTYTPAAGTVLTTGQHTLSATFAPTDTTDYLTGTATVTLTVTAATPQVAVTASANPVFVSNAVTFTATVASPAATPTGTVNFYDGTTQIGTGSMAGGAATLTTEALVMGGHEISAVYSGDSNYQTATSANLAENVGDFALSVTGGDAASSATVYPGTAASYPLTIAPLGGETLAGTVSVSVAGLPAGTTASITPATVAANAGTTNLMLALTPVSLAGLERSRRGEWPLALGLVLLPFAGTLRRARRGWLLAAAIAVSAAMALGISACSGITYTPHTYSVTVTGQSGNLSHTTNVKLTIE